MEKEIFINFIESQNYSSELKIKLIESWDQKRVYYYVYINKNKCVVELSLKDLYESCIIMDLRLLVDTFRACHNESPKNVENSLFLDLNTKKNKDNVYLIDELVSSWGVTWKQYMKYEYFKNRSHHDWLVEKEVQPDIYEKELAYYKELRSKIAI